MRRREFIAGLGSAADPKEASVGGPNRHRGRGGLTYHKRCPGSWARTAADTRDNQGKCLIVALRQSTLTLSDNQAAAKKPCGPQ
jgi:hypothetical protein